MDDNGFYRKQQLCTEIVSEKNSVEQLEEYVKKVLDQVIEYAEEEQTKVSIGV